MNMSWSTMKKLFGRKKNRTAQGGRPNDDDDDDRSGRLKNLEVFRPLPGEIARHVDSIKSTLTEMSDCRAQSHNQQFVGKLNDLLDFLDQNALLREYVNHVYSKQQQWSYSVIVGELRQTCEELSSQMKTMQFLNDRNSRAADTMTEIAERSKQYENRKKQVCREVESAFAARTEYKWNLLKTSADKQLLDNFLKEILSQKKAIQLRQEHAMRFLASVQTRGREYTKPEEDDVRCDGGDDEYDGDDGGEDYFDDSFGSSIIVMDASPQTASSLITAAAGGRSATENSSIPDPENPDSYW